MINLNHSELSAIDLYNTGRKVERQEHKDKESDKIGTLRGGNSGCLTEQNEVFGICHRKALARYKGLQPDPEESSYTWFDAGFANEEAWLTKMRAYISSMGPDYKVLQEEECPVSWETSDGTLVTGRPDIMIFKQDKPLLGLELKMVNTYKSAINIYCEDKPKIENLLQAAHYSMIHGCPFNLVYSYRASSLAPGWASRYKDKLRLEYEKTFTNSKTGRSFTKREYGIYPFTKEFKIGFDNDVIYYITDSGERVDTFLTGSGIKRYYELITRMDKEKDLFTRISMRDLKGNILPYNICDYCDFKDACNQFESDYDSWLDKVKLICEESK